MGTLAVGKDPHGVAVDPASNLAIVANKKADTVSIIDLQSFTVIKTVALGEHPKAVAVDADVAIVSNEKSDTLSFIDLATQTVVATIPVAEKPGAIAINPQTRIAVITHEKNNQISIVDLQTRTGLNTLPVGEEPQGVAINSATNVALIANEDDDSLSVIDLGNLSILGTLSAGRNPVDVAIDTASNTAVVANEKGQSITLIDLATATYALSAPVGRDPHGVAIHTPLNIAAVANKKDNTVSILSLPDGTVAATIAVGKKPRSVAIHTQRNEALVTQSKDDTVTVIDLTTNLVITAIPVGKDPHGIAVDESTDRAIVANKKENTLSIIDLNSRTVTATIPVGRDPVDVAIHPAPNTVLVVNKKDDTLQIIDLQSGTITATIATGRKPLAVAVSVTLNLAIVANEKDDSLTLIDLADNSFIATLSVGKGPRDLFIRETDNSALVVNKGDDTVSVVDLITQTVIETLPVGREPFAVAIHPNTGQGVVTNEHSGDVSLLNFTIPDTTAPTIVASLSSPANASGWHQQDVTVTFICSDDESGIATCPAPIIVSTEGAGQVISGTATDVAGNIASVSVTLSLDKSLPTITATATPLANAAGWHNTAVNVTFACTDALAGIANCSAPMTASTDGAGQVVSGTATDVAGNSATISKTLNIDLVSPTISALVTPAANSAGWHNGDVTVTFTCSDTGSGIVGCPAPVTVNSEGANQVVSGMATDVAGNSATTSVTLNLDKELPTMTASVTPTANAAGWHNSDVTVTFTCTDTGSGSADCPIPVTVSTEGAGQVVSGTSTDVAGNSATTSVTLNLDKINPVIQITIPTDGTTVSDTLLMIAGTVSDANPISGFTINGIVVTPDGSGAFTHALTLIDGVNAISVQATDIADNVTVVLLGVTYNPSPLIADFPALTIGTGNGAPGDVVQLPIDFISDGTVTTLQADILFDASQLAVGQPTVGGALGATHGLKTSLPQVGVLRIVITPPPDNAPLATGRLTTLPFTINAAASNSSELLMLSNTIMADGAAAEVVPDRLDNGLITIFGAP